MELYSNLHKARLQGADLRAANLSNASLFRADLQGAIYNNYTQFPDGFDPVAAGAVLVKDND